MPQKNEGLPMILIIDDNADDFEATKRSFEKNHLKNPIVWCRNGKDALDFLQKPVHKPALILLDLNMPGIDGRKVLEKIKNDEILKKIPVIILTTSTDEKDINNCYKLGASTYVQKPVQFEGLLEATKKIKDYWFEFAILPSEEENG